MIPTLVERFSLRYLLGQCCVILFCLFFSWIGTNAFLRVANGVWQSFEARSWEITTAWLRDVALEEHSDYRQTGYKQTSSHLVKVRYDFRVEGRLYTGSRLTIQPGAEWLRWFSRERFLELKSYLDRNQPFRCFVNPNNPTESVLYPDLRWSLLIADILFAIVFGGIGYSLLAVLILGYWFDFRGQNPTAQVRRGR